jgi:secondary thiamine-phosphate synthase enzyme
VVTVRQEEIEIETRGRGLVDVTSKVASVVASSSVRVGTCTVFVRHTSASLTIQENADPAVLRDLQRWIDHVAPEKPSFGAWEHDDEGPDDMPAHVKSVLTHTSEVVPITNGRLALGTWQAIYLWEHRRAPHRRKLVITIVGE